MKKSQLPPEERVSREVNALSDVLDRVMSMFEARGLLPAQAEGRPDAESRYVSADEIVLTARALWTRAYHPPKHEREVEGA